LRTSNGTTGGAKKYFGQHFLEPAWVTKLVRVIAPQPTDVFLEIGPGRGALTDPLTAAAHHVVAVEIDRSLAAALDQERRANLTVIQDDFLEVDAVRLSAALSVTPGYVGPSSSSGVQPAGSRVRVAGNLPYNVASRILVRLCDLYASGLIFEDAIVMVQQEVAVRLLADPGSRDYGVLGIIVGRWARMERCLNLPPGAFRPPPKVRSTVVRLVFHRPDDVVPDEESFRAFAQAIFSRRRKTIANALLAWRGSAQLSPAEALTRAALDGRRRPETFTREELVRLYVTYDP
jgi:16S rRNA (adenine1518-N6/adenine1519-N6)-dimethyltransferase